MKKKQSIIVQGFEIKIAHLKDEDYISMTDMVKKFGGDTVIYNWMRNRNTIEFLGIWETIHNPDFKPIEFDRFRKEAGLNRFVMSPKKWTETTAAIGIFSKSGRYGGTYAHKDIAFEFGSWLSPEFKLYLIKEFQRLKESESRALLQEWNLSRMLAKINYRIHTDAIKENLIPPKVSKSKQNYIFADEADLLNVALFGMTAGEWRKQNPNKKSNIRDYARIEQLIVLANIESINAEFIKRKLSSGERLKQLNEIAINQMKSLTQSFSVKKLKK